MSAPDTLQRSRVDYLGYFATMKNSSLLVSRLAPGEFTLPCLLACRAEAAVTGFEYGSIRTKMPTRRRCSSGIKGRYSRGLWFYALRPNPAAVSNQKRVVSDHTLLQVRDRRLVLCVTSCAAAGLEIFQADQPQQAVLSGCFLSIVRVPA